MIQRDWLSKTLAGVVLGLIIALECSALYARTALDVPPPIRMQLTMWVVMPVWLSILSGCYLFKNGRRAWLWLVAASVVLLGGVFAVGMV